MSVSEIICLLHKSVLERTYDLVPTVKNRNSRRKYGLTIFDIEDFLLKITVNDLYRGPVPDRDCLGEYLYVFTKEVIKGVVFYVKIKKDNGVYYDRIKIISCHEAEY